MDFLPDSDQQALADATRDFVRARFPLQHNAAEVDDGQWKEIAEFGWLGLGADEEVGGAGATLVDEGFVFREVGRGLVPGPILSTLAAGRLAWWAGETDLAASLIGGERRAARAVEADADGTLLVLDPRGADVALLIGDRGAALHPMPDEPELHPGMEDGTVVARINADQLGEPLARLTDDDAVARLRRLILILTSAQLAGIAQATTDMACEHAKNRVQFGKPIGAFQAIKHKCADMATNALAADNLMFFAALNETLSASGSELHAQAAAAFGRRAAFANVRANVQIHGAMGFTVETHAHRYVKRTHVLSASEELGRSARRLGKLRRQEVSWEK